MNQTPVCIIGAGPAGLAASLFLSNSGIRHMLIDREAFPRDKVCGESFDGKVFHILNRFDPSWIKELEQLGQLKKCWSYSLTNSWGHKIAIDFPNEQTPKLHIKRALFDHFLLQKVQQHKEVSLKLQTNVQNIIPQENGVKIIAGKEVFFAQLLIVSSGANSILKSFFQPKRSSKNTFLFARGYFRDIHAVREEPELEIFFLRRPFKGCLLLCPMANGETNVEIGMEKKEWKRHHDSLENLLLQACRQPVLGRRFRSARQVSPIKTTAMNLSASARPYVQDRILLAGSSAGSVNPVTGFGVGHAMTMGLIAAQQSVEAIEQHNFSLSFLKTYESKIKAKLRKEVMISHTITKLQKQVDILEPLIFLLSRGQTLANILSDKELVDNIFNPRFYWKHWRTANSKKG